MKFEYMIHRAISSLETVDFNKPPSKENNNKLVIGDGILRTQECLEDELFGIKFKTAIKFKRKVEVYSTKFESFKRGGLPCSSRRKLKK